MTDLWDKLEDLSGRIEKLFDSNFKRNVPEKFDFKFEGWKDNFWSSEEVRKCHLKIIDNRESRKLWLMHINIFPHTAINLPILGFDIVAGPKKITGAFFDYSINQSHPYMDYISMATRNLSWNKPRELPPWASSIFSPSMIAVGNVSDEIDQLCDVTLDLTEYYVENIKSNSLYTMYDQKYWHNFYCQKQKENPHLHRSILAMGISEEDKNRYVNEILFEEI